MTPVVTARVLKQKLAGGQRVLGSWITLPDPSVAEIMATAGFDFLTIDLEHSAIDLSQAADLIRVISLCNVCPLVRLSTNDATLTKRLLDAGAAGVIVPMVNSSEEAKRAVAAAKYPPLGFRSVGLSRAQGYGTSFESYFAAANDDIFVAVQIEHAQAVAAIDDILGVPDIDAYMVGPYDLSASMGRAGRFDDPQVIEALARVAAAGRRHRVVGGFHSVTPTVESMLKRMAEGYPLVAYSTDFLLLGETCRRDVAAIRRALLEEAPKK